MITFHRVERLEDGEHTFAVYQCRPDVEGDLVAVLAETDRELYVEPERLRRALTAAMTDAGAVADTTTIAKALERTQAAAIPERSYSYHLAIKPMHGDAERL